MAQVLVGTDQGIHDVSGDAAHLGSRTVTALARETGRWWALADGREVLADPIGPDPKVEAGLDGSSGQCLLASRHGLLVGTSEAGLLKLEGGSLKRVPGFDRVPGRDGWYTPWGGPPDTRSMAEDTDGTLYVNVHVGGIPVSADGESFRPTIDVDADVHQVLAHPVQHGRAFAATAMGLAETTDAGSTWSFQELGLHARYCRAVAVAGDVLMLSVSTGPRGGRSALYRRPLAGGAFERCERGLPQWFDRNINSHCLAGSGALAAFGTDDGRVFVSEDGGSTWREVRSGLSPVRCVVIAG